MADPVSILGTVVGVVSLTIQVSEMLSSYWKGVSTAQDQVEQILGDTQQLSEVLRRLQEFLELDSTKLSKSFTTTSTLYTANTRCQVQLFSLKEKLRKELEGSRKRKLLNAIRWPMKVEETQRLSTQLQGYIQTFQFALSLDGCQLLLQSSDDVSARLEQLSLSAATSAQQTRDIELVLQAVSSLPHQESEKVLKWLASDFTNVRHQTVRKNRLATTGEWFFELNSYKEWQSGAAPILWIKGSGGVGKSVLLSLVADRIAAEASSDEGLAFFYCEYSQASETQCATSIVEALIYQLAMKLDAVPTEIWEAYEHHKRHNTRPDLKECQSLLSQIVQKFSKVWLLIDAVDELDLNDKDDLMEVVENFKDSVHFFITSRPQSIDSEAIEQSTRQFRLSAQAEDLIKFIRNKMGKAATASRRVRESPGWNNFVEETVEKLVDVADGMFILVTLQLDLLLRPRTLAEMRKLLDNVSTKLDDFYANTLERIKARESEMALQTLCWLVKQMRPLSVREIQEALAVDYSTTEINADAFTNQDDILEMCCGFVIVNDDGFLSLSHATVHEFLSGKLDNIDQFDVTITKICLRYLSFKTFEEQTMNFKQLFDDQYDKEYDYRVIKNPFFPYAARHWNNHFNKCPTSEELDKLALEMITSPNVTSMLQAYSANAVVFYPRFTPVHVAAYLGVPSLVKVLIVRAIEAINSAQKQGSSTATLSDLIDSNSAFGNTPLLFAVKGRHYEVAKALLDTGAVNPSVSDNTIIRWTLDWKQHDLLRQMVKLPLFNEQLARLQFGSRIEKHLPRTDKYQSSEPPGDEDSDGVDEHGEGNFKGRNLDEKLQERAAQRRLDPRICQD